MSSTPPAICVQGLWKEYVVNHARERHGTFYDLLSNSLKAPFQRLRRLGGEVQESERFWALKDVSFDIAPGEVVGVIGRNGAGKSTLLKILSRITAPTKGHIEVRGRLASLLEVGTGFHPELSGRENIFLNGAILGMTRAEVARKFDEIVAFAEVEKFIDTPVKRYSSGMYVRLAFAVAAHLEPEILVIDEVLAVGDARFQRRCLGKMKDVAGQGRTVIFVSHNMTAVQRLCTRVIWLNQGEVRLVGMAADVVGAYLRDGLARSDALSWLTPEAAPGNAEVAIAAVRATPIVTAANADRTCLTIATGVRLEVEYWNHVEGAALNLSLHIYGSDDTLVLNAVPLEERQWFGKPFPKGRFRCVCDLPPHLLNSGRYRVEILVVRDQSRVIFKDDSLLAFEILEEATDDIAWHGRFPGVIRPRLPWHTERIE